MAIESEATNEGVCKKCGKSLSGLKLRKNRQFCSALCRTRFFALERYYKIKSTDEYKAKRRVYEKNWRELNKDAWNERMKKASAKYRAKKKLEKNNSNKNFNEGLIGQQPEKIVTSVTAGDAIENVEGKGQPSQTHTPFNEGLPGQQTRETIYSPELVGADAGRQVEETDQSSQICSCGHGLNNHSYDPESFKGNLACDICDCKNFNARKVILL